MSSLALLIVAVHEHLDLYATKRVRHTQVHAPAAGIKENAPVVGLVLQKSHINTKDECHYVALIAELEARGAKVWEMVALRIYVFSRPTLFLMMGQGDQPCASTPEIFSFVSVHSPYILDVMLQAYCSNVCLQYPS